MTNDSNRQFKEPLPASLLETIQEFCEIEIANQVSVLPLATKPMEGACILKYYKN